MGHIKEIFKESINIFLILFASLIGVLFYFKLLYESVVYFYETVMWLYEGGLSTLEIGKNPIFGIIVILFGLSFTSLVIYTIGKFSLRIGILYFRGGFYTISKSIKRIKNLL